MNTPNIVVRIGMAALLALVALLLIPTGCTSADSSTAGGSPGDLEMRTYATPEGYEQVDVLRVLNPSLGGNGVARALPDGSLVVTAPAGVHDGVEGLLARLGSNPPKPAPAPESVTLRYWAIVGTPTASGGVTSEDPALSAGGVLAPLLGELEASFGPMRLGVLEELRLTSVDDGPSSQVAGRSLRLTQRVQRSPEGGALADIEINLMGGQGGFLHSLETRVRLEPGRLIVLSQSAYNSERGTLPSGWTATDRDMLFYVVVEAGRTDNAG